MLDSGEELGSIVTLELKLLHDIGNAVLEFDRFGLKHGVIRAVLIALLGLLLDVQQLGLDGVALLLTLRENGLNMADLFGIREMCIEGDHFDFRQWVADLLGDLFYQVLQGLALITATGLVALFMLPLTSVQRTLDGEEQDIDEHIVQPEELMCNEADQVEMAIICGPARNLENARFEYRVGIVAHPLRRQIQGTDHRLDLVIQRPQHAEVLDVRVDSGWPGGLREAFEQRQ